MAEAADRSGTSDLSNSTIWKLYGYAWVTLGFFAISLAGHWLFGWFAFVEDQQSHGQVANFGSYFIEAMRDTLENWQSEFLQLLWQVGGLSLLLYVGSPQSRESEDRLEAKLDALLKAVSPREAEAMIDELDQKFHRK
jgi:hypothetical protein